jgi:glycine hydroxymethyltransferase
VTTRGLKEADMDVIAGLIGRVLSAPDDEAVARAVRDEVLAICRRYPLYPELVAAVS